MGQSEEGLTAAGRGALGIGPTTTGPTTTGPSAGRGRRGGGPGTAWRLRLLGRFTVEVGGVEVADPELGNRKARLLLKLLAVRRGHQVPMDGIVETLWADDPGLDDGRGAGPAPPAPRPAVRPARPVENVATLVSRLRATLGPEAIDGGRAGYRLVLPPGCTVDADDAERLVEEAEHRLAGGRPALAVTAAERALALLGVGVPLEEETTGAEWLDVARRDHERLVRRARAAAWRAAAGVGQHRRALALAEAAVADDALDEEAHRTVILAHHRLGEPAAALEAYERVRTTLVEELGADPAADTQALYLAVLRGEPVDGDELRASAGAVPRRTAPSRRGRLVGRDDELASLLGSWEVAAGGAAGGVLVVGEAGIGKTGLVRALAEEVAAGGATTVAARCHRAEESLFLQPVVEVLRELIATLPPELVTAAAGARAATLADLVPELAELDRPATDRPVPPYERASPEMERRRAFEAVAEFLASVSRSRPLLVVLDDLHEAGASTVELVHFALGWDPTARFLVVATAPPDRSAGIEAQLGARAATVTLGPLSAEAVGELARDAGRPALADELFRLTRGHTLFVLEALKAVSPGAPRPAGRPGAPGDPGVGDAGTDAVVVPASLRSAVALRAAACGPAVEELLRGAVVAGSAFTVEDVAELLGLDVEDALRRAEQGLRVGLLVEAGAGYEFANDVIRNVLYDTTPAPTRAVRHRRLAALLAHRPEAAAEHAAAAGDWETAVDHWSEAARRSLDAFANVEAEGLADRAIDACALLADPARTARAQLLRGRARLARARYRDAGQDFAAVQTVARATGDLELEGQALESLAWCVYHARDVERATTLAERALQHPTSGLGARVLAGRLRHTRGDLAGAVALLGSAGRDASRSSAGKVVDRQTAAAAFSYLGSALAHRDRYPDAVAVLDDAVERCRHGGLLRPMFNARFFGAMARANAGDLGGALVEAERFAAEVERFGYDAYRSRAANVAAWLWRELGEPDRAVEAAQRALEAANLADGHVEAEPAAHARLQLAESALLAGDDAGALAWLEEVAERGFAGIAFGWRAELQRLELVSRLEAHRAEELLAQSTRYDSAKYRALALALLGRDEEALAVASGTGSDLLVARVGPEPIARAAAERIAAGLEPEHRAGFLERGAWRYRTTPR